MKLGSQPTHTKRPIRAAVLDFDGTLSTFRSGWESVMRTLMLELLSPGESVSEELEQLVDSYIDASTGIQTVHQMEWLKAQVEQNYPLADVHDVWWYKGQYTTRLQEVIRDRIRAVETGATSPEEYLINGSRAFLQHLARRGVKLFLASGTDHPDVLHEARVLRVLPFFTEVRGAPVHAFGSSKEMVIRELLDNLGYYAEELLIVGDGPVEIELGREVGAVTLGVASNEVIRQGVNQTKERRLSRAGAHIIVGDFLDPEPIYDWLCL